MYDETPHEAFSEIKKELEELRKRSEAKIGNPKESDIALGMAKLTTSINELLTLFREAAQEIKVEEQTKESFEEKIAPILEKLEAIEKQNREIAEGILSIADMISEIKRRIVPPRPAPAPSIPPVQVPKQPAPALPKPLRASYPKLPEGGRPVHAAPLARKKKKGFLEKLFGR